MILCKIKEFKKFYRILILPKDEKVNILRTGDIILILKFAFSSMRLP